MRIDGGARYAIEMNCPKNCLKNAGILAMEFDRLKGTKAMRRPCYDTLCQYVKKKVWEKWFSAAIKTTLLQ